MRQRLVHFRFSLRFGCQRRQTRLALDAERTETQQRRSPITHWDAATVHQTVVADAVVGRAGHLQVVVVVHSEAGRRIGNVRRRAGRHFGHGWRDWSLQLLTRRWCRWRRYRRHGRHVLAVADGIFELAVNGQSQLKAVVVDRAESSQRLGDARPRRRHELLAAAQSEATVLIGCVAAVVVVAVRCHECAARPRCDDGAGASTFQLWCPAFTRQTLDQTTVAVAVAAAAVTTGGGVAAAAMNAAVAVAAVTDRTGWCAVGACAQFGLLARPVLVVGVFLHVQLAQSFSLLDVGWSFVFWQRLPAFAQPFWDLGIMHVRLNLANLTPLNLWPYHERIHRSFDVVRVILFRL